RSAGGRISRALCRILRPRLRLRARRRTRGARGVGGALARSALHPRARPDRRSTRLREDAGATPLALRRAHRLQLSGAGAQAIEAFPNLSTYGKSSMPSAIRFRAGKCHFQKNASRDATISILV